MPYLIDGHNLIGRFPGISLEDPEDERKLLEVLEIFARFSRHKVVVFLTAECPAPVRNSRPGGCSRRISFLRRAKPTMQFSIFYAGTRTHEATPWSVRIPKCAPARVVRGRRWLRRRSSLAVYALSFERGKKKNLRRSPRISRNGCDCSGANPAFAI
jgi:hypothetical protein